MDSLRPRRGLLAALVTVAFPSMVLALASPARADVVAHESFVPSFPLYANGGSGFAGPWRQGGFNAFASGYVPEDRSLCHPDRKSVV